MPSLRKLALVVSLAAATLGADNLLAEETPVSDGPCFLRGTDDEIKRLFLQRNAEVSANTPRWEGLTKTEDLIAADRTFVEAIKKKYGDPKPAAKHSVGQGWHAFNSNDPETAIRRFNQAWLLDDTNAEIYWGYALATFIRGDSVEVSECWFDEAVKHHLDPAPLAGLYSDRGRVLEQSGRPKEARVYFEKTLSTNPNDVAAHVGMAKALTKLGDQAGAKVHLDWLQEHRK